MKQRCNDVVALLISAGLFSTLWVSSGSAADDVGNGAKAAPDKAALPKEWPPVMLELEKLALADPQPGLALWRLRRLAIELDRLDAWRARWQKRIDEGAEAAAECILLGWLAIEDGDLPTGRALFQKATELAPESFHAWRALAEHQLRSGGDSGLETARRAAGLAGNLAQKVAALQLAPRIAQERGELTLAWERWRALEAEPLAAELRLALIPDFARAHLAAGDHEAWALQLAAEGTDRAVYARACLALGDPALAHRVASAAKLPELAAAAAQAAGFASEAAAQLEAKLGERAEDDALIAALETFAELGAPDHARQIFKKFAPQLAPIAARWRLLLPAFWKLGLTSDLREIFAPLAAKRLGVVTGAGRAGDPGGR